MGMCAVSSPPTSSSISSAIWSTRNAPGEHGTAIIFDSFGVLIAHPDFARLVEDARTHPSHPQLPEIGEIRSGLVGAVMQKWDGGDRYRR